MKAITTHYWIDDDGFICSGSGDNYITIAEVLDGKEETKDLIVTSVNNYSDMFDILKNIIDQIECEGEINYNTYDRMKSKVSEIEDCQEDIKYINFTKSGVVQS